MKLRTFVLALALAAATALPVGAATLRFAFQGDLNALDPYTLNESSTLGALGNVMEGLTKRDQDLKIIPGLAERWEMLEPTRWRFYLRKGVKFHNGEDFTPTTWCSRPNAPSTPLPTSRLAYSRPVPRP